MQVITHDTPEMLLCLSVSVSLFLDPWSPLISPSPTEPHPSLNRVFGMTYPTSTPHLFFTSTIIIANHKESSSSCSSVSNPRAFHSKLKFHLFKNSYPDSPDPLSPHSQPKLHPP